MNTHPSVPFKSLNYASRNQFHIFTHSTLTIVSIITHQFLGKSSLVIKHSFTPESLC